MFWCCISGSVAGRDAGRMRTRKYTMRMRYFSYAWTEGVQCESYRWHSKDSTRSLNNCIPCLYTCLCMRLCVCVFLLWSIVVLVQRTAKQDDGRDAKQCTVLFYIFNCALVVLTQLCIITGRILRLHTVCRIMHRKLKRTGTGPTPKPQRRRAASAEMDDVHWAVQCANLQSN